MKTENTVKTMHPLPENKLGYCASTVPLTDAEAQEMINGPLTAMQPKLTAELARDGEPKKRRYPRSAWFHI
jgi:hypothetical protein